MKALPFSVVSAVVTVTYSAACFLYFSQPFWGVTALCVGALLTFYPLYFDRQRADAIRDAQVAQYLRGAVPSERSNSVYRKKLEELRETLWEIERGQLRLTASELSAFAEQTLTEKLSEDRPIRYWATHLVDSKRSCGIWGLPHSTYPWHKSYTECQRLLLDRGGEVVRLFIFDQAWLSDNLGLCEAMVDQHELSFSGSRRPVLTLASITHQGEGLDRDDLSIIDGVEVFLWKRSAEPQSIGFEGGEYITDKVRVSEIVRLWVRHRANACAPEDFFRRFQEGRAWG